MLGGTGTVLYAKVIVNVPGLGVLDYLIPENMMVAPGDRVMVSIRTRQVLGIVVAVSDHSDLSLSKIRAIHSVVNDTAPLSQEWLALTKFASQYYVRSWGEIAINVLPVWLRRPLTQARLKRLDKLRERAKPTGKADAARPELNDEQKHAFERITSKQGFKPFLLFGITGSGKTEVYLHCIEKTLEQNPQAQVLLLVPEINLTPQLEARVRDRFPNELIVSMHSDLADGQRADAWLDIHEGRARVVIGTRLAIFSSFKKLGLIIVDEEHDLSFKAGDGARFHARDLAVWRAKKNQCPVVLGSATPSFETWVNAQNGTYETLTLTHRAASNAQLPELVLHPEPHRDEPGAFSAATLDAMEETLEKGRQVLVFLNRRGFAASVSCPNCNWVGMCDHCSTFTVYHKGLKKLICHHCGTSKPVPSKCPSCGNLDILPQGRGTERVEEELAILFPDRHVLRIDRDTTTTKNKAEIAFNKVHTGEVDILVGTQMIAKGHDFKNVGLVVILHADAQLMSPDMRAREHLFSTLMQVAGRAGRHGERGKVVIQSRMPSDPLFAALEKQDYPMFANHVLQERKENMSIPFIYQALLTCRSTNLQDALYFLERAVHRAKPLLEQGISMFDPVPMSILKLQDEERAQVLIESSSRQALNKFLWRWVAELPTCGDHNWTLEVDPVSI